MNTDSLPWEADEAKFVPPFQVGELLVTSLDGFLTAAALHMGDKLADGRGLERTDATEAWLALLGATALLVELQPILIDEIRQPYEKILADLLKRYADAFPDRAVPTPSERPIGTLRQVLADAWKGLAEEDLSPPAAEPPAQAVTPTAEASPPTPQSPMPRTGSGPLGAQRPLPRPPGTGSGPLPSFPPKPGSGALPGLPAKPAGGPLRPSPGLPDEPPKPR